MLTICNRNVIFKGAGILDTLKMGGSTIRELLRKIVTAGGAAGGH